MYKETILITVTWIKRLLGIIAILLWGYVIFTISLSPAPFMEQVPYSMVSTMLIFGILTAVHKGLDYWVLQQKSN